MENSLLLDNIYNLRVIIAHYEEKDKGEIREKTEKH